MNGWHLPVFSLFTFISFGMMAWLYLFQRFAGSPQRCSLVDKAGSLVGRRLCLESDLYAGSGQARLDGAVWEVRAEQQLAGGVKVEVVAADGLVLLVRPCRCHSSTVIMDAE